MFVYDITDRQSLLDVEMWLQEADKHGGPNLTKLLIGNKCDKNNILDWNKDCSNRMIGKI